jgi:hypothetical protein
MVYWFDISVEIISLIVGLIGILYITLSTKLVDHKLYYAGRLILLSYIIFILLQLIKLLGYLGMMDVTYYKSIGELLFIVFLTLAIIYLNKEFKYVLHHKRK